MGSGRFDAKAYRAYTSTTVGKTTEEVFKARKIHKDLDPNGVKLRESRDSDDNPKSTPLICALDVTGSMGILADYLAREGLGTLFKETIASKPITDPHVMFMAVGDVFFDNAPLQVSQFEADNRIVEQLANIWIEHGGGGNSFESYNLPWYFAAYHTAHDSLIKRAKRGYLFTVGDECAPGDLDVSQIEALLGYRPQHPVDNKTILTEARRKYDVYHIIIEEGDYASSALQRVQDSWRAVLGQHVISLSDHKKLPETIISTMQVAEGMGLDGAKKFGTEVLEAVKHLPPGRTPKKLISA